MSRELFLFELRVANYSQIFQLRATKIFVHQILELLHLLKHATIGIQIFINLL